MTSLLQVSNSDQDKATAAAATLSSPPSPIPYTMTTNYDNNTVLVWLQKQLVLYVDLHFISNVQDFTHTDYWLGKPLICLARRFFPEIMAGSLLELKNPVLELTVFKEKLRLSPIQDSKDDLLGWFSQLKQALINVSDDTPQEQPLQESVLKPLTKLFEQAHSISRRSISPISRSSSFSPISRRSLFSPISRSSSFSPRILLAETKPVLIKSQLSQISSGNASESVIDLMQQAWSIWNQWQSSPKPAGLRFSVEATFTALQLQLEKVHPTTAYFLKELESIATFTSVGIHDLEARSVEVGKLIDTMAIQYAYMLEIQEANEIYTALAGQYRSIVAWVDGVRTWFAEAERIRVSIEKRNHLLESRPLVSSLDDIKKKSLSQRRHCRVE
jgi:hypothetical protein